MININKLIAQHIVLAQISSDAGKGVRELKIAGKACQQAIKYGYSKKDNHINMAIKLMNHNKFNNFTYWCTKAPDQNGHISKIIYFNFRVDGKRYQVSFHSFGGWNIKQHIGKGQRTHWDQRSSRDACLKLIEAYRL